MNAINNFNTKPSVRKDSQVAKILKGLIKLVLLICFVLFSTTYVNSQKGFFIKFSLGPSCTTEYSSINDSGFSILTKNQAIGWGITDKFAVQIGEFGSLIKQKAEDYNYINLDAFGLGFSYRTPIDIKISVLGADRKVSFAEKWSESLSDDGGYGYGINMSIENVWFIAKRWSI